MLKANDFALLVRMVLTTAAVLGVLLFAARLAKRGKLDAVLGRFGATRTRASGEKRPNAGRSGGVSAVTMHSRTAVGRDQQLLCIEWNNEALLIAITGAGTTVLARQTNIEELAGDAENTDSSFAAVLKTASGGTTDSTWLERLRAATVRQDLQ